LSKVETVFKLLRRELCQTCALNLHFLLEIRDFSASATHIKLTDCSMAALGGPTVEVSPQLGQNVLIKELSTSQARDELQRAAHVPKLHHKIQKHMIDVAFGHLLGLNEVCLLEF
jgi:hypothetical protein